MPLNSLSIAGQYRLKYQPMDSSGDFGPSAFLKTRREIIRVHSNPSVFSSICAHDARVFPRTRLRSQRVSSSFPIRRLFSRPRRRALREIRRRNVSPFGSKSQRNSPWINLIHSTRRPVSLSLARSLAPHHRRRIHHPASSSPFTVLLLLVVAIHRTHLSSFRPFVFFPLPLPLEREFHPSIRRRLRLVLRALASHTRATVR